MYITIYFNDKPLFLCDAIGGELEPFIHHDDAIYIEELSSPAVNTMIKEMQSAQVHAGIFRHESLERLKHAFWKKFTVIQAGGGLVKDENQAMLFMFRRAKWDLPKGKLDEGETIEECALREVREETGLSDIHLNNHLITTYHTYHQDGEFILKETYWYLMTAGTGNKLVPQVEEDIEELKWVSKTDLPLVLGNTYPSVKDVVNLVVR